MYCVKCGSNDVDVEYANSELSYDGNDVQLIICKNCNNLFMVEILTDEQYDEISAL